MVGSCRIVDGRVRIAVGVPGIGGGPLRIAAEASLVVRVPPDPMTPIRLADAFRQFDATWTPHVAAELNGQMVKLAKLEGAFVWHDHAEEDELFWVVSGRLRIELRDADPIELGPGELVVVPRGVEHRPVALPTAEVVLFEPASTAHTGTVESERTVRDLPRL